MDKHKCIKCDSENVHLKDVRVTTFCMVEVWECRDCDWYDVDTTSFVTEHNAASLVASDLVTRDD